MKRVGYLFEQLVSFENLFLAFRKALHGKKSRLAAAAFAHRQEENLLRLQADLRHKTYRPGPYRVFTVYEKKPRQISAAPFRDRVVHHALCNVIEPVFERGFIYDSYANRVGKGTHAALSRAKHFVPTNGYVLKCDIRKYFASIDHRILKALIRRRIKDPDVLWLCDLIIDSSNPQEPIMDYFPGDDLFTPLERRKGLPIGNQTSQFFANVYLDPLDHFVKERLRCRSYLRYVDDFLVFGNSKEGLHRVRDQIEEFLIRLRLKLHPTRTQIFAVRSGVPFLGYVIWPTHVRLGSYSVRRFRHRLRELSRLYSEGRVDLDAVRCSVNGWLGHAVHASTYRLRRAVLSEAVFARAGE